MNWLNEIFGKILFGIDWAVFKVLGIHNTGLCIILLTIVVYLLMYPLNSKQQKSSRIMARINPEIQALQKKYKGKTDQASQMRQSQEMQDIYDKYGISPFGGCLPILITLPIMFCLYSVMDKMENYVEVLGTPEARNFLGLDVGVSPWAFFKDPNHPYGWLAFIIPILAVVLQFANTKMIQPANKDKKNDDPTAQSMKMMNYMMPLMSGYFCISLNIGIGLYWITGSLFRIVQAFFVNRKMDKIDMDELIEKNREKAAKKSAKRDEMNRQMEEYSRMKTSSIKSASSYQNNEKDNSSSDSNLNVNKDFKEGSISGYAHMLSGKSGKDK